MRCPDCGCWRKVRKVDNYLVLVALSSVAFGPADPEGAVAKSLMRCSACAQTHISTVLGL